MFARILLAVSLISSAAAFSTGAPDGACTTRTPLHGVSAQTSVCPYDFVALGWVPGEYTSMGIFPTETNSDLEFKGFLVSVFYNDEPIGEMRAGRPSDNIPTSAGVQTACDGTSLTHSDAENKKEIFFEWKAPLDLPETEEVTLRLTIAETRTQFWIDCGLVQLGSRSDETTSSSTFPTTSSISTSTDLSSTLPFTTQRLRTRPPTTRRPPQTRPPTTARPIRTRPPTTRRPPQTRPPTTARPIRTRPPTTRRPPQTRPPTTARPIRTRPPTTARPIRTRPPTTARPIRTRPPTTRRPAQTRPPTTARPIRTRPPATTRRPGSASQPTNGGSDSYLNNPNGGSLKHETMSGKECVESGNVYRIVPNTQCRQFTQNIYGSSINRNPIKCPGSTKFDPRVCSCAFTTYCTEP